jgi:hypothetical protein
VPDADQEGDYLKTANLLHRTFLRNMLDEGLFLASLREMDFRDSQVRFIHTLPYHYCEFTDLQLYFRPTHSCMTRKHPKNCPIPLYRQQNMPRLSLRIFTRVKIVTTKKRMCILQMWSHGLSMQYDITYPSSKAHHLPSNYPYFSLSWRISRYSMPYH